MRGIRFWFFRSVCRLALTMGIFCFIEIVFRMIGETTRPNYEFPWGYYDLTIGIIGVVMLATAYFTWTKPCSDSDSEPRAISGAAAAPQKVNLSKQRAGKKGGRN